MIYEAYPADEDLMVFISKPAFEPVRYRIENRIVTVVSDNEYHLNTFSWSGSTHEFPYGNKINVAIFIHDDSTSRYAGPITVYHDEWGQFYMRASFEFHAYNPEKLDD